MTNRGIRAVEFPSQISPNAAELIRLLCHPGTNLGQPVSFQDDFQTQKDDLEQEKGSKKLERWISCAISTFASSDMV